MKRLFISGLLLVVVCVIFSTGNATAETYHRYTLGTVTSVGNGVIFVDNNKYFFAPKMIVISRTKQNGAYFEDNASLYAVRAGLPVTLKVEGSTVYEIFIERWKQ